VTGTYLVSSNLTIPSFVTLRGDGPSATIIHYTGTARVLTANNFAGWAASQSITVAAVAGATSITVNSAAGMAVGGLVIISQTNPTSPFAFVQTTGNQGNETIAGAPKTTGGAASLNGTGNDPNRCLGQVNKITNIVGNVLTLERPLYLGTGGTPYVNYQGGSFNTNSGVESLQISCTGTGDNEPTIDFGNSKLCWIKNIKVLLAASCGNSTHVFLYNSYACEIRDSWFSGGGVNASGQDYGVYCEPNCSECLIENNVFVNLRHAMIVQGASGNVYGYNCAVGSFESGSTTFLAEDQASHGWFAFYNLWEGNISAQIDWENTHAGNGWNTAFRNWALAWSTSMSTSSPVAFRYAVVIDWNSYNDNVAGNVYGQSGDVTTSGAGVHFRGVSSDYLFNDPNNPSVPNTNQFSALYYLQGNYSFMLGTIDWNGGTVVTLPASLYQGSKPSWWTTEPYPPIGPDLNPVNSANPASDRFNGIAGVMSISPTSGPQAGATTVTITGISFTGATAVKFGTVSGTSLTVVSDTSITIVSPAGTGTVDVTVVTPGGTSAKGAADLFTFIPPIPTVTGVSPNTGSTAGGEQVTVTGFSFTGATAVKFGGTNGTGLSVTNDNSLTITSPAKAAGTVDVTVTNANGTSSTSSADQFTYFTPAAAGGVTSAPWYAWLIGR
jgi:hypothetical protein